MAKLVPRHLQKRRTVKSGEIAKRVLEESFSPEQSASMKRLEERILKFMLNEEKRA